MATRPKLKHPAAPHPRAPRIPLLLRVTTRPGVGDCWSLNVSTGGMALTVARLAGEAPREGAPIEIELVLPESESRIAALARVVWVDEQRTADGQFGFGVAFEKMAASDRAALERYLADFRPRVVLANATAEEARLARHALEPDVSVLVTGDDEELAAVLGRGNVYAAVLFADEEHAAQRLLEIATGPSHGSLALTAVPRVILCAHLKAERLLRLHGEGKLFQSLRRPADPAWLRLSVQRACEDYALRSELRRVHVELERAYARRGTDRSVARGPELPVSQIVFEGPAMRNVLELVRTVAPHKAHVLLQGETGTGKELLARAIHGLSPRADRPFVALDCGALPETLLESELFGHVQGAFTGATGDRPGLFQVADGGTLFLDEIENTTAALQAKLLRVIDTGELRPVGGTQVRRVDVRLLAASNRDLKAEVDAARFRADLYYRLSTFPIDLPPLRQRGKDLARLAGFFAAQFARAMGRPTVALTPEAERLLAGYQWPGNVRELRNAMERAVLLTAPGQPIEAKVLPPIVQGSSATPPSRGSLQERLGSLEEQLIRAAMERSGGRLRAAARELGMSPATLSRRARRYGLALEERKPSRGRARGRSR